VKSVSMVGTDQKIAWTQTDKGLKISFPKQKPNSFAYPFKIQLEGLVTSVPEPYFVERDPNPPTTADTYIYNHGKASAPATIKLFANGKEMESRKLLLKPGSISRIESSIVGIDLSGAAVPQNVEVANADVIEGLKTEEKAGGGNSPFSAVIQ